VIGIDYVQSAIKDAGENSTLNNITNTRFFHGDIAGILTDDFVMNNGSPGIVITDPPRTGMNEKVIRQLIRMLPSRIVYISCNPATQARDIALFKEHYTVSGIQPVDMFPHTQHVENVALLQRKEDQAIA
jgi:23S rRNA (uracil1939-C5)-methyltransferase